MSEFDAAEWADAVERHRERAVPAARQIRTLSDEEAAGLFRQIAENGQLAPVLVLEDGRIVDGVHRSAACELIGLECVSTVVNPASPDRMAVELNAGRRQMTTAERAREAENYAQQLGVTIAEAARVWSVAERHISRIRRVLSHDDPQMHEQVRNGAMSLGAAEERVAEIEAERQREAELARLREQSKPVVLDSDGLVANRKSLRVIAAGADTEAVVVVVAHALRNGVRALEVTPEIDTHSYGGAKAVVAWTAPTKKQNEYTWRHVTIFAVDCADAWKKVLPEWREPELRVWVSRAAAKELGMSEGEHAQADVAVAIEKYDGGSVAVRRLLEQLAAA